MVTQIAISSSQWQIHQSSRSDKSIGLEQRIPYLSHEDLVDYLTDGEALALADFIYANFKRQA